MRVSREGRVASVSLFEEEEEDESLDPPASTGERVETSALVMPSLPPPPPLPATAVTIETAFLPRGRSRTKTTLDDLLGVLLGIVVLTPATALACALVAVVLFR